MGKMDDVLHRYLDDAERFADFYNGALFGGQQIIDAGELSEASEQYKEVAGKVVLKEMASQNKDGGKYYEIIVKNPDGDGKYIIPYGVVLKVKNGDVVEAGSVLTEGSIYPNDFLRTRGVNEVQNYLLNQGVELNTKHVEIIIRQMLRNVKVEDSGDTSMLVGDIVDHFKFEEENEKVIQEGGVPASAKRLVQGITKAALSNPSFLAAASFQETSRVLTDASIKGKVDNLVSLKENLMIGKQIPAGTGYLTIRNLDFKNTNEEEQEIAQMDERTNNLFEEFID